MKRPFRNRKTEITDYSFGVLVDVEGTYYPGEPARLTGDPYYSSPEEPAYFEITHVWLGEGDKRIHILPQLSDFEITQLEADCCAEAEKQFDEPYEPDDTPSSLGTEPQAEDQRPAESM